MDICAKPIPLPMEFLCDKNLLGAMVRRADARASDMTLYLWKLASSQAKKKIPLWLDYAKTAAALGMDSMTPERYRRQINMIRGIGRTS